MWPLCWPTVTVGCRDVNEWLWWWHNRPELSALLSNYPPVFTDNYHNVCPWPGPAHLRGPTHRADLSLEIIAGYRRKHSQPGPYQEIDRELSAVFTGAPSNYNMSHLLWDTQKYDVKTPPLTWRCHANDGELSQYNKHQGLELERCDSWDSNGHFVQKFWISSFTSWFITITTDIRHSNTNLSDWESQLVMLSHLKSVCNECRPVCTVKPPL